MEEALLAPQLKKGQKIGVVYGWGTGAHSPLFLQVTGVPKDATTPVPCWVINGDWMCRIDFTQLTVTCVRGQGVTPWTAPLTRIYLDPLPLQRRVRRDRHAIPRSSLGDP